MHATERKLETLKVLLIEDNPIDASRINVVLRASDNGPFRVTESVTLSQALSLVREDSFDVALLDLSLPNTTGIETFVSLHTSAPTLPIVILTGHDDERQALEAVRLGAQDYLTKNDYDATVLARALHYAVERKRLMEDLKAEHERALLCDKCYIAKDELEKKNRNLVKLYQTAQRFVDNVSHEFRTPLTVIKEYVALVGEGVVGEVNDEQRRMLTVVEDRADDLNTMVDDMLDSSKLESGLLDARRRQCRVADIIYNVRPALERKAAIKGVTFEIDLNDPLPDVYCDPEKAGRVITNLAINALKFCRESGLVKLWCREDDDSHRVIVGVTDDGPGINEKDLTAIFRRFKQVGGPIRSDTQGFGLGLNIAKELVHLNFGEISVESKPDRGSTFSFTLLPADPIEVVDAYLSRIESMRNGSSVVSFIWARVEEEVADDSADELNETLNRLLRHNDLLFRVGRRQWLLVLPVSDKITDRIQNRLRKEIETTNRNRPGDKLPLVQLRREGTWYVATDRDAILIRLNEIFAQPEVCCV